MCKKGKQADSVLSFLLFMISVFACVRFFGNGRSGYSFRSRYSRSFCAESRRGQQGTAPTALSSMSLRTQKMRQSLMRMLPSARNFLCMTPEYQQSMATSGFLFLLVNIQETTAGLLLLRRYLRNAGKINIKNTFLTSLYGGKCAFSGV